jgi:hypothetical protein
MEDGLNDAGLSRKHVLASAIVANDRQNKPAESNRERQEDGDTEPVVAFSATWPTKNIRVTRGKVRRNRAWS